MMYRVPLIYLLGLLIASGWFAPELQAAIIGGTVESVVPESRSITVKIASKSTSLTFTVSKKAVVVVNNKKSTLEDIEIGQSITVTTDGNDKDFATKLTVRSVAAKPPGKKPARKTEATNEDDESREKKPAQKAEPTDGDDEPASSTANPLAQAASLPKEPRPDRIVRQATALSNNGIDSWLAALEAATGTAESRKAVFLFLTDFNRLFDKTTFRDDESAKLINRMKVVPQDEIEVWKKALTNAIGEQLISELANDNASLVVIIQQDLLFNDQEFDRVLSQTLCQRLSTIPPSAVDEVTEVGKQDSAMRKHGRCSLYCQIRSMIR